MGGSGEQRGAGGQNLSGITRGCEAVTIVSTGKSGTYEDWSNKQIHRG